MFSVFHLSLSARESHVPGGSHVVCLSLYPLSSVFNRDGRMFVYVCVYVHVYVCVYVLLDCKPLREVTRRHMGDHVPGKCSH